MRRLSLPVPATIYGNTDNNVVTLLAQIDRTLEELKDEYPWPELVKEYTFTLSNGVASYALPTDYNMQINETMWNRTQQQPLIGPLNAVEWQSLKSGLVGSLPNQRFRVKGAVINQFFIDPTPGSDEDGQTCVYEYISSRVRRPTPWVASTDFTTKIHCSYNGNYYTKPSGAPTTTGTTPPTHTTGSASDGSITWTIYTGNYAGEFGFNDDSNEIVLDAKMVIEGTVWRFKQERGLDYESLRKDAEDRLQLAKIKLSGADVLSVNKIGNDSPMIGPWSYPEGSF